MKAIWNGVIVAESNETVVVEGNHYFPHSALKQEFVIASEKTSVCGWKGTANYYSLQVAGKTNLDAVWYYAQPLAAAANIKNHVAFWRGVEVVA